ncbi:EamA family transporter [Effusibacillus pohliae]|uniref:EamA family transporter n=1 Tax=Effusibacillus pohliae TaxID=232270 RepID=UPI00035E6ECC|nr:DMT family transporter [Effusibacillus pohliae]
MDATSLQPPMVPRLKGFVMALAGASLWGLSGTVAQLLFEQEGVRPGWLVTVRMIVSGVLLLILGCARGNGRQVWSVWSHREDRVQLLIFGIIGMLGVQYTYFAAIETGNAATATLLQYLGPAFITLWLAIRSRRMPGVSEFLALGLALVGTFFLVTNGSLNKISISGSAVAWGLTSAVTAAFYTLYPVGLLQRWGALVIVGWGMVIGGTGLALVNPPWQIAGQHWSLHFGLLVSFVIVFGTLIPFYLFLDSLRYIKPAEASLLASAEPLTAAAASVVWLNVPFGLVQGIGGLCIISTVTMLSLRSNDRENGPTSRTMEMEG